MYCSKNQWIVRIRFPLIQCIMSTERSKWTKKKTQNIWTVRHFIEFMVGSYCTSCTFPGNFMFCILSGKVRWQWAHSFLVQSIRERKNVLQHFTYIHIVSDWQEGSSVKAFLSQNIITDPYYTFSFSFHSLAVVGNSKRNGEILGCCWCDEMSTFQT